LWTVLPISNEVIDQVHRLAAAAAAAAAAEK